jgi:hypothetical protein
MAKRKYINDESGIALVIALVMLLALTVIGVSSLMTSTLDTQISGNERRSAEALNLADAGVERGMMDLLFDFSMEGDQTWDNDEFWHMSLAAVDTVVTDTLPSDPTANYGVFGNSTVVDPQFGDPFGAAGLTGPINNSVDLYGYPGGGPVEFPAGSGNYYRVLLLRELGVDDEIYMRSYALHSTGARKIVQVHIDVDKVDAWRNAIFALSGNAEVVNGYKTLSADRKSRISDGYIKTTTLSDGTEVETLEAVVRVKRGQIDLSGSGNIGETEDADGNAIAVQDLSNDNYKSTIDTIYANEGFTDTSSMNNVHADNYEYDSDDVSYETESYDLGDKVQMPQFKDDYDGQTDRSGQDCVDRGESCDIYGDYVEKMSVTATDSGGNSVCALIPDKLGGDGTPAFCSGCDSSGNCVAPDPATCNETSWDLATCGSPDGCIKWDPDPDGTTSGATLNIEGRVKLSDDCVGDPPNVIGSKDNDITYEGKGLLYTAKDIDIAGNLLSEPGTTGAEEYFVEDHLLAVMTKSDMEIAPGASPIDVMGAFYALGNITSGQPSNIVGSIMSNSFNMSTGQASSVYQVQGMSDELFKLGMIRSSMVYTFKKYEWVEKW